MDDSLAGRRGGADAEAPAGPPHVSGTVFDKAAGLRTRGNTGVRLRSGWEIRKRVAADWPRTLPSSQQGRREPHCARAAQTPGDERLLRQTATALWKERRVSALFCLVHQRFRQRLLDFRVAGGAGTTCRLFRHKSALHLFGPNIYSEISIGWEEGGRGFVRPDTWWLVHALWLLPS